MGSFEVSMAETLHTRMNKSMVEQGPNVAHKDVYTCVSLAKGLHANVVGLGLIIIRIIGNGGLEIFNIFLGITLELRRSP